MTHRGTLSRLAAGLAALSMAVAPTIAQACTFMPPILVETGHMKGKCRAALAKPERFLARIQSGKINRPELDSYVLAFDDGKFGCQENKQFVFRMLDRYYSVGDRKLTQPELLRRYAFAMPEGYNPAQRKYVYGLVWLFTESGSYLPVWWTAQDARAFVERPEHWPIALARFGQMRERDDAVFASVVDPASPHFDRQLALKLADFPSKHRRQRRIQVAALFVDARFGPPDLALAESLLPASAVYGDQSADPYQQQARSLLGRIAEVYAGSSDPALRTKGQELLARMAPPVPNGWPAFQLYKDGRVWLSPANWPQKVPNPFVGMAGSPVLFTPDDYPVRARREEMGGLVTVAARFGPDGKFTAVDVVRSSGNPQLDTATASTVARRFRPKLADMTIPGFAGREVMVPLLTVNWVINDGEEDGPGWVRMSGGVLTVVAPTRSEPDMASSCGFPPSIFI